MILDGFTLACVTNELEHTIIGGKIQKIRQHNDSDITLEIYGRGTVYRLFASVGPRFPRLYLTSGQEPVPQTPPNFCMVLRKHLEGLFIAEVGQVDMDRIVTIKAGAHGKPTVDLVFEVMGKHSNVILVDESRKILGAIKHVGTSVSRARQILPGREYILPPGTPKIRPHDLTAEVFDRAWDSHFSDSCEPVEVKKWLVATFSGFGPFLAEEIIARSEADRESVRERTLEVAKVVVEGAYAPVFITDENGAGKMVYPVPSVQFPESNEHPRTSICEALDTLFRSLVTRTDLDEKRASILGQIKKSITVRKQALKSAERTLAESENAERYQQIGDLVLASQHMIEKGQKTVTITDYYDPKTPQIEVELDAKSDALQNAQRYFRRARKARDSVESASGRRETAISELDLLDAAQKDAENAKTVAELDALHKSLVKNGLLRQDVVERVKEDTDIFAGHRIRRVETPEGYEIFYGETATANDYLTQRIARPNDVWLHARQITGAHVVVRMAGRKGGLPRPVLLQAAKIAAKNSDAKHSSLVPVDHTLRKYVNKPRKGAPGFVTYRNEKTIDINPKN